jgi:putative membrane protein insertion efficiency factor
MAKLESAEPGLSSVPRSLPVHLSLLALRFYKTYLSILFAGNCRFHPTCSQYAYEAIARFGVGRGIWLGLKRLLRCHPLSRKVGYDPVPETWDEARRVESVATPSREIPHEVHS